MNPDDRLQIDDDWKSQAEEEKRRLAQELDQAPPDERGAPLGTPDFRSLVNLLAVQVMFGLGAVRDARGAALPPNPELAKLHIDVLEVLSEKTRGNLTEDEQRLLNNTLYELRMAYVDFMSGPPPTAPGAGPARS